MISKHAECIILFKGTVTIELWNIISTIRWSKQLTIKYNHIVVKIKNNFLLIKNKCTNQDISILLRIKLCSDIWSPTSKLAQRKNIKTWQRSLCPVILEDQSELWQMSEHNWQVKSRHKTKRVKKIRKRR